MGELATLIKDLALILIAAGITTLLCKKLKQPLVIGYILAGFLIGPVVSFVPTVGDMENVNLWAEIGVIFLMFALGLDFNLHKLAEVGSTGTISAALQVAGMVVLGFGVGQALGWSTMDSVFLGGMLSMSSTMITIKAVEDMGMKDRRFAQLSVGTLIIEDIMAIFMMVVLSTLAVSKGISGGELAGTIGKMLFYLAMWLILGIYLIPSFLKKTQRLMNDETLLVVALGICFGMVWLADALGFSAALGAFLAGSILAGTLMAERIEHLVKPCKDLFGAVFFVSVGFKVVPSMLVEYWWPILLLILVTIVGKILLLTAGLMMAGEDLSTSLHSAFSQTQIGEFSFIIATLGISLGVTSDFLYPVIVAVSVITTFTTPYFIRGADGTSKWLYKVLPDKWRRDIDRYNNEKKVAEIGDQDWRGFLKGYLSTFALYSMLIFGIIQLGVYVLLPFLEARIANALFDDVVTCGLIYVCIAPLVPPLMVFRKRHFTALWLKSSANHLPLLLLIALRTAVTVFLVMLPAVMIFKVPLALAAVVALVATIFFSRSDWLMGRYLDIEARFLSNFNERKLAQHHHAEGAAHSWLDEQLYVGVYRCQDGSAVTGKSLMNLQWGKLMKVNVIKIIRGRKHINIPEGHELIQEQDRLFVLGTDKALANFTLMARQSGVLTPAEDEPVTLRQFVENQAADDVEQQLLCYAVDIDKASPLSGTSLKDSKIKEKGSCILIGLERDMLPIVNPSPNMVLSAGDILWILGNQRLGSKLIKGRLV